MGHAHNIMSTSDSWVFGGIIFAFIIAIAGVVLLIHRKRVASEGLTPIEREELDYPEREILSMLRQHGGAMMQSEISGTLTGELEDLVRVMNAMESKKLIQRE